MDKSRRIFIANTTFGGIGVGVFKNSFSWLNKEDKTGSDKNRSGKTFKNYYKSIKFTSDNKSSRIITSSVVVEKAKSVFSRIVKERTGIDILADNGDELQIKLAIYP